MHYSAFNLPSRPGHADSLAVKFCSLLQFTVQELDTTRALLKSALALTLFRYPCKAYIVSSQY